MDHLVGGVSVCVCVWRKAASEGIRGLEEVAMGHEDGVRGVCGEQGEGQGAWQGAVVLYFNCSWRIIWAVIDPPSPSLGRGGGFRAAIMTCWPEREAQVRNAGGGGRKVQEDNGEEVLAGRQARRLYVAIKFNIITLTSDPGTQLVNKQGGTCYNAKDADLRLYLFCPPIYFCMMAQFTRGKQGEERAPDTTSNTTAWLTARPKANSQVLECFKFYDPLSPNLI